MECPCKLCKKRYVKMDSNGKVISNCHSECPEYKKYDAENIRLRELRLKRNTEAGYMIETLRRIRKKH